MVDGGESWARQELSAAGCDQAGAATLMTPDPPRATGATVRRSSRPGGPSQRRLGRAGLLPVQVAAGCRHLILQRTAFFPRFSTTNLEVLEDRRRCAASGSSVRLTDAGDRWRSVEQALARLLFVDLSLVDEDHAWAVLIPHDAVHDKSALPVHHGPHRRRGRRWSMVGPLA